jgi:hypothetical protein
VAIGYWIVMPARPIIHGYTHGLLNHSQRDAVTAAVKALQDARRAKEKELSVATLQQVQSNPICSNLRWQKAGPCSATIVRRATVRAGRAHAAIPI